jgi:hypothetical protein
VNRTLIFSVLFTLHSSLVPAQDSTRTPSTKPTRLFRDEVPLAVTLTADFHQLFKDRDTLNQKKYPATLVWSAGDDTGTVAVELSTRGHSRLLPVVCDFTPLWVHLPARETRPRFWHGQPELKLTVNCKPKNKDYEQYVLQEYLLYRMYGLFTEMSFRTRLAHTTYLQAGAGDTVAYTWAFFVEDADDLARRNQGEDFQQSGVRFGDVDSVAMLRMGVFNYMIGNTDWSLPLLHNVRILKVPPGLYYTVPYDFDFAGIIKTPYAHPSPKLPIKDVRDRLYRGPCPRMEQLEPIFAEFNARKDTIYALHRSLPDFDPQRAANALKYLDEFYRTINNPGKVKSEFRWQCE